MVAFTNNYHAFNSCHPHNLWAEQCLIPFYLRSWLNATKPFSWSILKNFCEISRKFLNICSVGIFMNLEKLGEKMGFVLMLTLSAVILFFILKILNKISNNGDFFYVLIFILSVTLVGILIKKIIE